MTVVVKKSNILSWNRENVDSTPDVSGVYVLRNIPSLNGIIYIGSSENLNRRLVEHWLTGDVTESMWFDWYETTSTGSAKELEKSWISQYSPKYNTQNVG